MIKQQERLYRAERLVRSALDWARDADQPVKAEVFGSTVYIPSVAERKFADLASVQRYVDCLFSSSVFTDAFGKVSPVRVRERKGNGAAHYHMGEVALFSKGRLTDAWAMREIVVLHEVSHHVARGDSHGPRFAGAFLHLITNVVSPEVGLLLTEAYVAEDVRWVPPNA